MATYKPEPLDTAHVILDEAQKDLIERLASNVHDVWSAKRIADGWTYGPARNDDSKSHPCLVPYADLPDSEKEYDRVMVDQVLRAVLALGYHIAPASHTTPPPKS